MSKLIAKALLDIEAVSLSPNEMYTWSSGIQSPIYCDNRVTLGYPEVRTAIRDGLIELIEQHFADVEIVSGTATAGIPHAAYISDKMNLPMNYVRSKSKSHGKQNQIEGARSEGKKVVVIEDLISTGGSSITAVEALQEAGAEVLGVVAIFTYGLNKASETFKAAGVPFYTLSNYDELIEVAREEDQISEDDIQTLVEWRNQL
ncbi:TPA: orotate phosphoribosyltransferase [Staphylococcus pseudintermedius]|uniref:orotate phosphoribosyltransferase n=1 Tax=Staphylococcus pseudintermedius TaxID=283734 RepID=UPI000809493A|nr:orotate phosphoribosyltransferase [Staphylococcus pseudintermedius]ANS89816.1 Orotate phosphoribosyltransferase [Staphylococcus pseudintermedius]EGQ0308709.1 orotate phosphoribosyltransferase [Staphylococcus pseudintermedius]EGQ0323724.1 orotate phosphoribosyltransferase [Staphylococcus pseudintermedius]EGQ0369696.1 orotate phosphoribosyltransferase [Staphylococcus pseudintermedius]EGQ0374503.1 orotate phosphoribosyltransferase [Staphylococcus pseudintermedius]